MTAWRRLHEWQEAGGWARLQRLLLERLQAAGEIDWSRALIDASYVQAKKDGINDWRDFSAQTRDDAPVNREREEAQTMIACGFDVHRVQITFDRVDHASGEVRR